jgi:hypothetical protein
MDSAVVLCSLPIPQTPSALLTWDCDTVHVRPVRLTIATAVENPRRPADKQDKLLVRFSHKPSLRAAVSRSGCASFVNRLSTSPGRLFLGLHSPSSPARHCSHLVSPASLSHAHSPWCELAAFGAIHLDVVSTRPLCSHLSPPASSPCSLCPIHYLAALQAPRVKRPALRPLPLLLSLLSSRSLIVIRRASFAFCLFIRFPPDWSKLRWIIVVVLPQTFLPRLFHTVPTS